jgi:flavin reductase (DIM6/NTAB) family NADH-FMN oxidoreductase RutF
MLESIRVEHTTKNVEAVSPQRSVLPSTEFDTRRFRNALGRFASGVTVITAHHGGRAHGMTANSFVSVSLNPPLVLVSLGNRASMHRILPAARRYGISVLGEDQENLSNHFAGRIVPNLHVRFVEREGVPLLEGAVAYFVAALEEAHPAGDHTLYIGRVEHFEWNDEKPLLFYAGRYRHLRAEKGVAAPWEQDDFSLFSIGGFDPPVG